MSHALYLSDLFNPHCFKVTVERTLADLSAIKDNFDSVAFRGFSGGLIAPIVCYHLQNNMVAVRKGEKSHSTEKVETVSGNSIGRFIVIDDQISSGHTMDTILSSIERAGLTGKCVGVYLYRTLMYGDFIYYRHDKPKDPGIPCLGRF